MTHFTTLTARVIPLPIDNIDTDQIIPARYLKATDKKGMGEALFADWRYNPDGSLRSDFILNQPAAGGAQILLAGDNFGCGSSREHAPWALTGFGFRAVMSTSFADIFRNNALKNGLLPIIIDATAYQNFINLFSKQPEAQLTIDLATQTVTLPDKSVVSFPIDVFSKNCLLRGLDELGYLLSFEKLIGEYEASRVGILL